MPYTVTRSFEVFTEKHVDLNADEVKRARISRDYLKDQLALLSTKSSNFPPVYGSCIHYGSFARRTKIRPLNDIDIMFLLSEGNTKIHPWGPYTYQLEVLSSSSNLWRYTNDSNTYLNSTKILNKIKEAVASVASYHKADIKKNGVAVVLNLISYPWVFDIVPSFPISDGRGGISYYLIPDGKGMWIRTDPRKDQTSITTANQRHNGNLLALMRLMKYWNAQYSLPSYYFETLIINGLKYQQPITSVKEAIPQAFEQLASWVSTTCPDPKGFGPSLDAQLDVTRRVRVQQKAKQMAQLARIAISYEQRGNQAEAINQWRSVFPNFPMYGP